MVATVEQLLRTLAKTQRTVPYWILEKDYALSYLLAGVASIGVLQESLVLKGGTALRKYYFAGYRFSEDLDFSLRRDMAVHDIGPAIEQAAGRMERLLQERGPFFVHIKALDRKSVV